MTGADFKAIRRFNRINQADVVVEIPRLRTRQAITELEKQKKVPERFVKVLSNLIGVNLMDEEFAKEYYSTVPDEFKKLPTRIDRQGSRDKYKIIDTNGNEIAKERLFTNNNRKRKVAYCGV